VRQFFSWVSLSTLKLKIMKIRKNYPLFDETTFKIGGPAEFFVEVFTRSQLEEAVVEAEKQNIKKTILGGGSNVLIPSEGIKGLVIKLRDGQIEFLSPEDGLIRVDAGVSLPMLSSFCLQHGLTGIEWAMGVPGTLGGAVYGNAGAFGQWISEIVQEVEVLKNGERLVLESDEINFSYRQSTFKEEDLTILSASLELPEDNFEKIKERVDHYLLHRNNSHPMDKDSAGSVFKNPETKIKTPDLIEKYPLLEEFNEKGVIPAGYLIEMSGMKGSKRGGAAVSNKHANFIVNENEATSEDVKGLIEEVQEKVKRIFGIDLEREIRYL